MIDTVIGPKGYTDQGFLKSATDSTMGLADRLADTKPDVIFRVCVVTGA